MEGAHNFEHISQSGAPVSSRNIIRRFNLKRGGAEAAALRVRGQLSALRIANDWLPVIHEGFQMKTGAGATRK